MREVVGQVGAALVVLTSAYVALTLILSRFRRPVRRDAPPPLQYVFLVPALNEERVIGRTLESLTRLPRERTTVLVVDDGSDDRTAEIVRSFEDRKVVLLRRRLPDARHGKGAALNAGYRGVQRAVAAVGWDPARVVVGVVDGDGDLPADLYDVVDRYFEDARTGALQIQVRIRNRARMIGRWQDYEFHLFASLTQSARENLGTVGLGGNGQFVRFDALESVGADGPWSDCLTEDLDLGLRLAMAGWHNRFTADASVEQQGVESLRRLVRQRTRWMQGHFQCYRHLPALFRSQLPTVTVLDFSYYLLAPTITLVAPLVFVLPFAILVASVAFNAGAYVSGPGAVGYLLLVYAASFGPLHVLGWLYWRRSGDIGWGRTLVLIHVLALFSWVWYAAGWLAVGRIVTRRGGWSKTDRVSEGPAAGGPGADREVPGRAGLPSGGRARPIVAPPAPVS